MDFADNPERMYLANFGFRTRERFLYEYDFGDAWLHEVRIEKRLPLDPMQTYPVCIDGKHAPPLEDCCGAKIYMQMRQGLTYQARLGGHGREHDFDFNDETDRDAEGVSEEQMAAYLAVRQRCPQCAQAFRHKDQHPVVFRTLFGNLELSSPRWFHCACQPHATRTFSPLAALLTEHCSPERLYLETKWASLVSFNLAAQLLQDVLPTDSHIRATSVRNRQLFLNPEAEHYLDWFHVTMRLTVMGQYAKGLPAQPGEDGQVDRAEAEKGLERIKWYLWHGNVVRALDRIEGLAFLLDGEAHQPGSWKKLAKAVEEFHTYIHANAGFIPNYGERWRNGDFIASGFVESTVNEVVSKRMVTKQQMQWTPRGAHLLLQARTKVLNEELDQTFQRWYPGFRKTDDHLTRAA